MSSFSDLTSSMSQKYQALEKREQSILLMGAIFLTIFVITVGIYQPMSSSIDKLEKSTASNQQLLAWMTQSVASITSSGSTSSSSKRRGRSLNVVINTTASKAKISISRSQPRDNKQYQIWLDKTAFKDLLIWLNLLQKDYGIFVKNINLGATDSLGFVRVNLTFQDSSS